MPSDQTDIPGVDSGSVEMHNEFASVAVSIDHEGNGPRLRIEDLKTGQVGFLDPLELETLAWLPEGGLNQLMDPSALRWREPPTDPNSNESWER